VTGVAIPLSQGLSALARWPSEDLETAPPSAATWSLAAKLALDLVARERVVPLVRPHGRGAAAGWGVSLSLADDAQRFARLARAFPPSAHAVPTAGDGPAGRSRRESPPPVSVWAPGALLVEFLDAAADLLLRQAAGRGAPARQRQSWESRFVTALAGSDPAFAIERSTEAGLLDQLTEWIAPARGSAARTPRLCLKLDPPDGGNGHARAWDLRYLLQAADDPSLLLPADQVWASAAGRLRWMDRTFVAPQEHLLGGLARAARLFAPIERSLEVARPASARLTDDEAWSFLSEAAPLLGEAGFTVMLPAALSPSGQRRLKLRMRAGSTGGTAGAVTSTSRLSMDALVEYRWEVSLGDTTLSRDDFDALAALKRPLVRWRGEWILLDPREVADMRRLLHESPGGTIRAPDALAAALVERTDREGWPAAVAVTPDGPLASLVSALRSDLPRRSPPDGLAGTLRPYQERGLAWLARLAHTGLGGCLADDMGLGKTIQAIAFLLARRAESPGDARPALIVCPTSVVGNWERELSRFAPDLPVHRHHGPDRPRTADALQAVAPRAVVLTTYGLLRRDQPLLREIEWAVTVLDEAQNIKNAASRQAGAARALRSAHRFALTGTPVENRLAELWSILDFCLPGLLGPLERFRRRFAIPIERYRDDEAAAQLRRLVRPFLLRRLKSDPGVAADLPPKQEMAMVCTLTREQATLYQATVDEALARIERTDGIQRRGLVLALLTALKQICNHPAHYLREPGPLGGRSGKLDRLTEMLEETVAAGDRSLVFTQFRAMGDRLVPHLAQVLDAEVLFLHGGTPRPARDEMVRRFQEEPRGPQVFVLSLKAGGTGLNLTRATRVFHFDRWWNPAVEDQATDRAHRIGQRQVVQVYRLLTAGTVEEKIDGVLADKRALAERIVGAGEAWITELSDRELRQLLALSTDAVIGDDEEPAVAAGGGRAARRAR
jgi:SNF2 family DNA or RNA helicase